ncbi:MAG TPA: hypothetical protein VF656_10180 [Pyrinomonadaceae bacterium]|jgi:hypothetical protein
MYHHKDLRRPTSLFLVAMLLIGHLFIPSVQTAAQPLPGNGIFVSETKIYDDRSLALMFYSLQAKLANRDFFDQGSVAAALGKFQGARLDASSFGLNLTTTPIPGITTTTATGDTTTVNTGGTTSVGETGTQNVVQVSPTPGQGTTTTTTQGSTTTANQGSTTSTSVVTPNTTTTVVTQPSVTPAAAALPAQTSAFAFQPSYNLAPQTLLAQQMETTHALDNVRLLLEGALTDRIISTPVTIVGAGPGATYTGARSRAVVGFKINLDSLKRYEGAVAEVEITVTTQAPAVPAGEPPSVVSVLPRENNYNVATVTKNAKQFGFGVAVQPINVGLSAQTQKETLFLVQDTDTVSFERAQPWDASTPPPASVTFGWQFRPVLGQKTVKAGPHEVFATLALPADDLTTFVGKVEARTFWRKYDSKNKTVGDYIKDSDSYQKLKDLTVPGVLALDSEPLQPEPLSLNWMDAGQGNILVISRGQHYLPGMGIILGNQVIDNAEKGLFLQSDKSFRWLVPGQRLAFVEDALIAGRFGPPAKLRNRVARTDTGIKHLTITQVTTSPVDGQNSKVTVGLHSTAVGDFNPIITLGSKAYGFSDAPLVKSTNTVAAAGGRDMVVEFVVPTQTLREASKLTARLLFFGQDYTAEMLAANFTPPGGGSFMASKVIVLTGGAVNNLFAITGSGFDPATISVNVDGVMLSPGARVGVQGVAGTNGAILTFNDPTFLTLSMPAELAKKVKQITLVQGGAPIPLPLTPPTPPTPKPKIADIEAVNMGDQVYVKVTGENLGSVDKVLFHGTALKTKNVSDDGKTMEVLITKEMSETKGRRSIDFVSKDGTTEVSGELIVRP